MKATSLLNLSLLPSASLVTSFLLEPSISFMGCPETIRGAGGRAGQAPSVTLNASLWDVSPGHTAASPSGGRVCESQVTIHEL